MKSAAFDRLFPCSSGESDLLIAGHCGVAPAIGVRLGIDERTNVHIDEITLELGEFQRQAVMPPRDRIGA